MADTAQSGPFSSAPEGRPSTRLTRLFASRGFQKWAARFPLTRRIVRTEGEAMFDLVAGFCQSQVLQALVCLEVPQRLVATELTEAALARHCEVPLPRMEILINAGIAIGLLKRRGDYIALTQRGAALAGVPGLDGMIRHHDVLYRDLSDPVAFFRGETETELANFWPYVFGAGGATDPIVTATYSTLMADSQVLVAEDTLAAVSLRGVRRIMDVGGGSGAFLGAVAAAYPTVSMTLFDLPMVAPSARARFEDLGFADRLTIAPGSFRDQKLPEGADMISLIRVLYDHSDATVAQLLTAIFEALPAGGRLLISEPMTGGKVPTRPGDAYFALYCLAMRTGRARSAAQIKKLLATAGFSAIKVHSGSRPFVTTAITSVKLD